MSVKGSFIWETKSSSHGVWSEDRPYKTLDGALVYYKDVLAQCGFCYGHRLIEIREAPVKDENGQLSLRVPIFYVLPKIKAKG